MSKFDNANKKSNLFSTSMFSKLNFYGPAAACFYTGLLELEGGGADYHLRFWQIHCHYLNKGDADYAPLPGFLDLPTALFYIGESERGLKIWSFPNSSDHILCQK